jgi:hypothetical protein
MPAEGHLDIEFKKNKHELSQIFRHLNVQDVHFLVVSPCFYLGHNTLNHKQRQFQVGDGMLTKVVGFAQKSIHPGLSRCAVPRKKERSSVCGRNCSSHMKHKGKKEGSITLNLAG